jgi:hypothetical protein
MKLNNKGFSLAETLLALAITSLITICVASGTLVGIHAYWDILNKTHAQTLYTEYAAEFQEGLRTAEIDEVFDVTTQEGHAFHNVFYSRKFDSYGTYVPYTYASGTTVIVFQPLIHSGRYWNELEKQFIVSTRSAVTGLFKNTEINTELAEFSFDNDTKTFTVHLTINITDKEDEVLMDGTFEIISFDAFIQ